MGKDIKEDIQEKKDKKARAESDLPEDVHIGKMAGFIADVERRLLEKIEKDYGNVKKADKPQQAGPK